MITHYLKVAFRNHAKNKIQSIITLVSMAISFACVSLAIYWNHYEYTYDSFQDNYERIYQVGEQEDGRSLDEYMHPRIHTYLMNNYPEVEKACALWKEIRKNKNVVINKVSIPAESSRITPEAVDMFGIQWIIGNKNMLSWTKNQVAISEHIARQTCGKESPLGLKITFEDKKEEYEIVAVFKTWPQHSNFKFDILKRIILEEEEQGSWVSGKPTYILLNTQADPKRF